MNEKSRMDSISRRISRSLRNRLLWVLLCVDALIVALTVGGFCYQAERTLMGASWTPEMTRSLHVDETLPWYERLDSAVYVFSNASGEYTAEGGAFFAYARTLFTALLACELVLVIAQNRSGKRRAEKLLEPLHQMALTAQKLSTESFDPQKYHDLETAIMSLAPDSPDAELHTGDSELKGMEEAVNSLLSRMRDAYREQTRFVSDASHELRTPIAVIQGYAGMLARWGKTDEKILDESIAAIKSESENMQRLVEQLLFLARGDSGRARLVFERFSLTEMLREVYEESGMIDGKHDFRFQAGEDVLVTGDIAMLKQTARILCDNAAKYTPEGEKITIRVFVSQKGVPGFAVQDNGIGIPEKDVPHIFERFYRSDPSRERSKGGTGLGLSIAKWIVERHGGYFEVVSREGIGTRIAVLLPQKGSQPKS